LFHDYSNIKKEACPFNNDKVKENEEEKYFSKKSENECAISKIISFSDYYYSIKSLFILYIITRVINLFNEKFICLILINILLFYGPIEKRCPYFLFKTRMFIKQFFQGIFGVISCLIPSYEDKDKKVQ